MAGSTISFNASGLKFDIKTFNDYSGYKGLDNYGFDNVYDEIDYSQNPENNAQVKENAMEQITTETKTENKSESVNAKETNVEANAEAKPDKKIVVDGEFIKDKGINVTIWAATKGLLKDGVEAFTKSDIGASFCTTTQGFLVVGMLEGIYKAQLEGASGGNFMDQLGAFASGFSKSTSSSAVKEYFSYTVVKKFLKVDTIGKLGDKIDDVFGGGYKGIYKDILEKMGEGAFLKEIKNINPGLFSQIQMQTFTNTIGNIGIGFGIEYGASIFANWAKCLMTGKEVNFENLKLGSTLLKSSTKMICATAGELIGMSLGNPKLGKLIGTVVGATIAEFQVASFDGDETWCAIAGGVQLVGAVAGAAFVIFCCSNPVGWVVGLGVLAGAAIGYALTFVVYKCWEPITEFAGAVWDGVTDVAGAVWDGITTTVDAIGDGIDYVQDKISDGIDYVSDKIGDGIEYIDNKIDQAVDYVEQKVKANPVTNFLVGWMF